MPLFVIRFFTVVVLLLVAIYLVPEEKSDTLSTPIVKDTVPTRFGASPVPKDLVMLDDLPYSDREEENEFWTLDLVMPKKSTSELRPALVFVHSGGATSGDKRSGFCRTGPIAYAKKGFVCISVNYRASGRKPLSEPLDDIRCAVRWLRAHATEFQVDPQRIGAYGNSGGAHLLSLLALTGDEKDLAPDAPWQNQSSQLNAVCVSSVPADFTTWDTGRQNRRRLRYFLKRTDIDDAAEVANASPITHVHADAPPFLIFQGAEDQLVHVNQVDAFVEALKTAGARDVTYHRYPEGSHNVFDRNREETYPLMEQFFTRTLQKKQATDETSQLVGRL